MGVGGGREGVIDSRRHFFGLCSLWYPTVCSLHRFFFATARVALNEDVSGGDGF